MTTETLTEAMSAAWSGLPHESMESDEAGRELARDAAAWFADNWLAEIERQIKIERDGWHYDPEPEGLTDYQRGRIAGLHDGLGLYALSVVRRIRAAAIEEVK